MSKWKTVDKDGKPYVITSQSFESYSSQEGGAQGFSGKNTVIRIISPTLAPAIDFVSAFPNEKESHFPAGTKFRFIEERGVTKTVKEIILEEYNPDTKMFAQDKKK